MSSPHQVVDGDRGEGVGEGPTWYIQLCLQRYSVLDRLLCGFVLQGAYQILLAITFNIILLCILEKKVPTTSRSTVCLPAGLVWPYSNVYRSRLFERLNI
jgi:hypothetical protein